MTRSPRAVLFDMDGLLVDSEPLWFRAETEVARRLGVTWTQEHQHALLGSSLSAAAGYLLDLSDAHGSDGAPCESAAAQERVEHDLLDTMERLLDREGAPLRPGATRLLDRLARERVPLGLVSSSYRVLVDATLAHVGADRFTVTVAGDEVAHRKPHPEPYLRAAELLGVEPADCLVLEDSPPGVASARAAGCPVVAVPSLVPVEPAPGVLVVPSLECLDGPLPAPPGEAQGGVADRVPHGSD